MVFFRWITAQFKCAGFLVQNLRPRSHVDETKSKIWSNLICTCDRLSGMLQAIKERMLK